MIYRVCPKALHLQGFTKLSYIFGTESKVKGPGAVILIGGWYSVRSKFTWPKRNCIILQSKRNV